MFNKKSAVRNGAATLNYFALLISASMVYNAAAVPILTGHAVLPAQTWAAGPQSGQNDGQGQPLRGAGGLGPFQSQPVQGFSSLVTERSDAQHWQGWALVDNGYGAPQNSRDFLLRNYPVAIDWLQHKVSVASPITFNDQAHLLTFALTSDSPTRELTGNDFDPESMVRVGDSWYVGDEFGPYLLHFSSSGQLLAPPQSLPLNVPLANRLPAINSERSPQVSDTARVLTENDPYHRAMAVAERQLQSVNLPASKGLEAMTRYGDGLLMALEGTVVGDPARSARCYFYDLQRQQFTQLLGYYPLEEGGYITEITMQSAHLALVIERDNGEGATAKLKRIYQIDLQKVDEKGFFHKQLLVDLLNIADPNDLDGDGKTVFSFPYITTESIQVLADGQLLLVNDNNFPFSAADGQSQDQNVFIRLQL